MRLVDPILKELDMEAEGTRKLLSRLPNDKLGWKPHPKSRSLGALAMHIATMPGAISAIALQETFELRGPAPDPPVPATPAEIAQTFEESLRAAKEALAPLDDARALADWSMTKGGKPIMTFSRIGFLRRVMLNHAYHHRGQLTVYLRLLGVPLPAVYASSADENPFAM